VDLFRSAIADHAVDEDARDRQEGVHRRERGSEITERTT
jgi:hypothetical protein